MATLDEYNKFKQEQGKHYNAGALFLSPGLDPQNSDSDFKFLKDESIITEVVDSVGGDSKDLKAVLGTIYSAVQMHKSITGHEPSPDQLTALGANIALFQDYGRFKNKSLSLGKDSQIIAEAVSMAATQSDNINIIPHFMTITALTPLVTISSQLCYNLGTTRAEKITVHELKEQAGKNPYGIPEGTEIDGKYNGGLSRTTRILDLTPATNGVLKDFSLELDYPIRKERVFLYVNKKPIGQDNGSGNINLIGTGEINPDQFCTVTSTVNYWNSSTNKSTINATIALKDSGNPLPAGIKVWAKVTTDVEGKPEFISETKYDTTTANYYSSPFTLRTGLTFQAIIRGIVNLKLNIKDLSFSRLLSILTIDRDRTALDRIKMFAGESDTFDMKLLSGIQAKDQWSRVSENMNKLSLKMGENTNGKALANKWCGGADWKSLFVNLGKDYFKPSPGALDSTLAAQPHYVGKFQDLYDIFYNPDYAASSMYGVGKGEEATEAAVVCGITLPPVPFQHGTQVDLASRCTLYGEQIIEDNENSSDYICELKLTDTSS